MRYWGTVFLIGMPALLLASQPYIYKSTDQRGRVTYAEKPVPDAVEVEQVQVAPEPPKVQDNQTSRAQSMMNLAREFEQSRLELERIREERRARERQLAIEMEQFRRQQYLLDQVGRRYNYGFFWPYPRHPHHKPHPGHPIVKPHPTPLPSRPTGRHSGIVLPIHRNAGR